MEYNINPAHYLTIEYFFFYLRKKTYFCICIIMYNSKMKPIIPNEEMQLPTAFLTDIRSIIDTGRRQAYAAVGQSAIATFWNVGRRIVEEEQNGQGRAAYGTGLIKNLAEQLIPVYGTSYSKRNLDYYRKFYLLFPNEKIVNARVHNLSICCQIPILYAHRRRTAPRD